MANINKNELYNLICEFYENEENITFYAIWHQGLTMAGWADTLGVEIAPATITALVRANLLVVEEVRNIKFYHKPYTIEEQKAVEDKRKYQYDVKHATNAVKNYEDRKRRAMETYDKCVADAKHRLEKDLVNYEREYNEGLAFLEEHNCEV